MRAVVAGLSRHDIPRLGWPASVLPPIGVHVGASERGNTVAITASDSEAEAIARLDLKTREVVVDAFGDNPERQRNLWRVAVTFADDRSSYDQECGLNAHPWPPEFNHDDPDTWTSMQILAYSTLGYWYPPLPRPGDIDGWFHFPAASDRFNGVIRAFSDEATAPRSIPLRDERSSADPATPDLPEPVAE